MRKRKLLAALTVAIATIAGARTASAASVLVTADTSFTVNWFYDMTAPNPDLAGSALFTISNYSTGGFTLTISNIQNTTATSPDINARLTSFGFGLDPDATSYSNAIDGAVYAWGFSNFAAFKTVDVCAYAGQNCAGGANAGLGQGESTNVPMSITFAGNFVNGVTFSPIPVKFQTNVGSFEFDGTTCTIPGGCDFTPVPEPASLMLLGLGLVVVGSRARRRRAL
jgi:hypothetical protein